MLDFIKVILLGIIEGITEWLPISSTGHLILFNDIFPLGQSDTFKEVFLVVIQLGAILAVLFLYYKKLNPFTKDLESGKLQLILPTFQLWVKILVACLPAAIIGILFDDLIDKYLYNAFTVGIMLILFGVAFVMIENRNERRLPIITSLRKITYSQALIIGLWQVVAAVLPGTSRSGATILGALLIGISRPVAAEFTFFLAIPVMFGASLLKLVKAGFIFTGFQYLLLLIGSVVAFVVSVFVIKFLLKYIKNNDFKIFGYYRIGLGILVLLFFGIKLVF